MELQPSYTVRVQRLDPTLAEVQIALADVPADVEVRGRVMGPRCPGVSTVEVAYPLRPLSAPTLFQVLIPDPSLWTEQHPFVYEGPVEFFRAGTKLGRITVSFGIKKP